MKNKKLLVTILIGAVTYILSAQSVEKAFINMPDEYYLSLPSTQRREMVKAYKTDSTAVRKNKFRGESAILQIDTINQFIAIQNSKNGKVSLKILNSTSSNTISYYALIFTACAPICDSHIGFYNSSWKFIGNSFMPKVQINDFLDKEKILAEGKTTESVAEHFDIVFIETHFVDNGNNIEAVLNSEKYLDKDSFIRLKPYLKGDKILYNWVNDMFKKDKCYW